MPVRSVLLLPLGLMCAGQIFFLADTVMRMARSPHQQQEVALWPRDVARVLSWRRGDVEGASSGTPEASGTDVTKRAQSAPGGERRTQDVLGTAMGGYLPLSLEPSLKGTSRSVAVKADTNSHGNFLENDVERFIVRDSQHIRRRATDRRNLEDNIIIGVVKIPSHPEHRAKPIFSLPRNDKNNIVSSTVLAGSSSSSSVLSLHDNATRFSATVPTSELSKTSLEERCRLRLPTAAACRKGRVGLRVHETSDENCNLVELLQNCTAFRRSHGYDAKPVTEEEKAFPLAFAIKMHTAPEQVEQLLRTIYRPHNAYCIHVDKKAPPGVYATMQEVARCLGNVVVLQERVDVIYASARLLHAELLCMRSLLRLPVPWAYYLNLAGQEFPLRTNLEMVQALKILDGVNDIETFDCPRGQEAHFRYRFEVKDGELVRTNLTKAPFPFRLTLSKGSAYGAFSRPFVRFLLEDGVARDFLRWLEDAFAPEEMAWATLNTLPWAPGGYLQGVRHAFKTHASRAVIWAWDKAVCRGRFIRSVCVFGARDLPWLLQQPQLVANKFHASWDAGALDCLEAVLLERSRHLDLSNTDWAFFRNLPHVEYYARLRDEEKTPQHLKELRDEWLQTHARTDEG